MTKLCIKVLEELFIVLKLWRIQVTINKIAKAVENKEEWLMTKAERKAEIKARNAGLKVEILTSKLSRRIETKGTRNSTSKKLNERRKALEQAQKTLERECSKAGILCSMY